MLGSLFSFYFVYKLCTAATTRLPESKPIESLDTQLSLAHCFSLGGHNASIEARDWLSLHYYEYIGCTKEQEDVIKWAWIGAGTIAKALYEWYPPNIFSSGAYQPAMDMYMGTDSAHDSGIFVEGPIKRTIVNQYRLYHSPMRAFESYFYCDATDFPLNENNITCSYPGAVSYAGSEPYNPGARMHYHHTMFCPPFFNSTTLPDLFKRAEDEAPVLAKIIDPWHLTRESALFHETLHWINTVSEWESSVWNEAYTPKDVYQLARLNNTRASRTNPQSYALAGLAILLQQHFRLADPPPPKAYAAPEVRKDPALKVYGR